MDIPFREKMYATFTDSSLPWIKRMEIIGEETFKKFEKFLVEDIALSYVSEQAYKSFFGYLAKGYEDPQVKAIFTVYKSILTVGDILLFALDSNYKGVAFEIDYGPSFEDIHTEKETFTVNNVSFDMVHLTGAPFMMGATDDDKNATSSEKPAHAVTISDFAIGETEVTQALWEAVMGSNPSKFKNANRPVENVSWLDCQEFIIKLNTLTGRSFRLPTEAEWEYAATGGLYSKGFLYSGSNDIDNVAWYKENSGKEPLPVRLRQHNAFGLYDMSGNVFEWCQDYYDANYYKNSPEENPCNDVTATLYARVLRGGCWYWGAEQCRVSARHSQGQGVKSEIFGLRLAMSESPTVPVEAIDLGLPSGTKWASCNVGATKPEEFGGYYAWGEIVEKNNYSWATYKWCSGSNVTINKYCYQTVYGRIDNKTILDPEDDVANIILGPKWRMPTKEEQDELRNFCDWEWTSYNGVSGMMVKSKKNNNFIFLPAAGYIMGTYPSVVKEYGYYQSASLDLEFSDDSYYFFFNSNGHFWQDFSSTVGRDVGFSVRPVYDNK